MTKDTTIITKKTYVGAGIILAKPDAEYGHRFLVLKGRDTGVWSFSKGHPELHDKETPLRTAVRETFEETGIRVGPLVPHTDGLIWNAVLRYQRVIF